MTPEMRHGAPRFAVLFGTGLGMDLCSFSEQKPELSHSEFQRKREDKLYSVIKMSKYSPSVCRIPIR
jgi:hypothetical protein